MCCKGTSDAKEPIRGGVVGNPVEIVTERKGESGTTKGGMEVTGRQVMLAGLVWGLRGQKVWGLSFSESGGTFNWYRE